MLVLPRERRALSIRLVYEQPWVCVQITDSGPSLAVDLLSKDFEPFRRGNGSRGLGLGLAISKTIVDELGGRLEAESRTGGGASFRVLLPTSNKEAGRLAVADHVPAREVS
jgi:C4-dicarboxylate-specific signal transduction histidine kinase